MRKVFRDGREKLTGKDYTEAKKSKWLEQGRACALCGLGLPFSQAEADHIQTRGMGGSKRDDRPDNLRIVHSFCHRLRHWKERDNAARIQKEG